MERMLMGAGLVDAELVIRWGADEIKSVSVPG
jgi:hypothetical protein